MITHYPKQNNQLKFEQNKKQIYRQRNNKLSQTVFRKVTLFFINRRVCPYLICKKCGYKLICSNCSLYLTFHKIKNKAICHHFQKSINQTSPKVFVICYVWSRCRKYLRKLKKHFLLKKLKYFQVIIWNKGKQKSVQRNKRK